MFKKMKVLTSKKDSYYDRFSYAIHLNDQPKIMSNGKVTSNPVRKLTQVGCGKYGVNEQETLREVECQKLHPKMADLREKMIETFGTVQDYVGVAGFSVDIEFWTKEGMGVYFLALGNNGQEISTGLYLDAYEVATCQEGTRIIQTIDGKMLELITEANVFKFDT